MKNFYIVIIAMTLGLMACSSDHTTQIPKYDDSDLQERVAALESLTATHTTAIASNTLAISTEASVRAAADTVLTDRIAAEEAARLAGDQHLAGQLAAAVAVQSGVNILMQSQISYLMGKLTNILSVKIPALQSQIDNKASISYVNSQISQVNSDISTINSRLSGLDAVDANLQAQIDALSLGVDSSKVKVFKCNMASSEERFLKIGGKYYGAMNQVTTGSASLTTSSTPQQISIPCVVQAGGGNSRLKFCSNSHTSDTVTIPAYTTTTVPVVTNVQISLEALVPGQGYVTTDGTAPCSFNGDGTNLVEVQ